MRHPILVVALGIALGGCDKAQPAPASGDASTASLTLQDFSSGAWTLRVNRRHRPESADLALPTDPLDEEDYQSTPPRDYAVNVSEKGSRVSIGEEPLLGELTAETAGSLTYDLSHGTFAGGRFVVWAEAQGLQAELTLYGSGVPVAQSERGTLTRDSR